MPEQLWVVAEGEVRSYYDLESLLDRTLEEYFPGAKRPAIRWGRRVGRKRRRSIRLGSYSRTSATIRIHPFLDSSRVPLFFVQSIIHHEVLHHVLGASHDRRFHRHERRFRHYREARAWLRANLAMLLGLRERPRRVAAIEVRLRPPLPVAPAGQMLLF
ncbi:MAG TPA: hypothetical protein VMS56_00270 [Thermoanaerobaculia bacterium]|nr:hypothetical protein [Thermoanaerobaculia bacterium]